MAKSWDKLRVLAIVLLAGLTHSSASGEDKPDSPVIPSATVSAQVVDSEGKPVTGARVAPWALRTAKGHGLWKETLHGPAKEYVTDEQGVVTIEYPQFWKPVGTSRIAAVSVNFDHADFYHQSVDIDVLNNVEGTPQSVVLQHGTRLSIAATKAGETDPLADSYLLYSHELLYLSQRQAADHRILTEPLRPTHRWLYVVHCPPEGLPLFSLPYEWNPDDAETHTADLEVQPGAIIRGRLSDDVPRPIKNGKLQVFCVNTILEDDPWEVWTTIVDIGSDGQFQLDSVPLGTEVQLIAMCDGYISAKPPAAELAELAQLSMRHKMDLKELAQLSVRHKMDLKELRMTVPTVVSSDGPPEEVVLGMDATVDLSVRVVDAEGRPLAGYKVYTNPNQLMLGVSSMHVGDGWKTLTRLQNRDVEFLELRTWSATTNQDGLATIHEAPTYVSRLEIKLPNEKWAYATAGPGKVVTVTVPAPGSAE